MEREVAAPKGHLADGNGGSLAGGMPRQGSEDMLDNLIPAHWSIDSDMLHDDWLMSPLLGPINPQSQEVLPQV